MAESNLRDMLYKAIENLTAIRRLRTVIAGGELSWPADFRNWLEQGVGCEVTEEQLKQGRVLTDAQKENFDVQKRQRESELRVLEAQVEQRRQEVREQESRREQLSRSLALIRQQLSIAAPLLEKRSYSRVQYLELQERAVQAQGELETLGISIPRAQAAAEEAAHRMELRKAELDSQLMEELIKRRLELASLRESLSAGSDRVTRTELRSPVRGTVKQIYITTVATP